MLIDDDSLEAKKSGWFTVQSRNHPRFVDIMMPGGRRWSPSWLPREAQRIIQALDAGWRPHIAEVPIFDGGQPDQWTRMYDAVTSWLCAQNITPG